MGLGLLNRRAADTGEEKAGLAALRPLRRDEQGLEADIRDCLLDLRHNQMLFDLETEPELIDQRVYEALAIESRYRYLQRLARAAGLRAIL